MSQSLRFFNIANMSFSVIRENEILANISEFTVDLFFEKRYHQVVHVV